jgi:hypothetical protein
MSAGAAPLPIRQDSARLGGHLVAESLGALGAEATFGVPGPAAVALPTRIAAPTPTP